MNQNRYGRKVIFCMLMSTMSLVQAYSYLPDEMSLSNVLIAMAHNSPQSIAYQWRYAQQKGTLRDQWNAGARGMKINFHWRTPMSFFEQMAELTQRSLKEGELTLATAQSASKLQAWFNKFKTKANRGLQKITQRFQQKDEMRAKEPFIALCHEEDTGGNCMLSAYLQKKNEVDGALEYCKEFAQLMKENPNDIAYIVIDDAIDKRTVENGASIYDSSKALAKLNELLEQSGLARYALKVDPKKYSSVNGSMPDLWPTVGELRKADKRLIIFSTDSTHAALSPYLNPVNSAIMRGTHWEYDWEADLGKKCKLGTNQTNATLFSISHNAEASIQVGTVPSFVLSALNKFGFTPRAAGGGAIKGTDYTILNSKQVIRQRVADCEKVSPLTPVSIIGIDFIEDGEVYQAIKSINKDRAEKMGLALKE